MANNRIAYGLAKEAGIDTTGMTPKEVWRALKEKGVVYYVGDLDNEFKSIDELKKEATKELLDKEQYNVKDIDKSSGLHYDNNAFDNNTLRPLIPQYMMRQKRDSFKEKLKDAPDGTYDYDTGDPVSYEGQKKWQVSFQTTDSENESSDGYITDEEYDRLVNEFIKETGSKPYLGKFEVPETSFVCESFAQAMCLAKKYNQMSIWGWETMEEIPNPDYNPIKNSVKGGKRK